MKKKINRQLILISVIAVILTLLAVSAVFYQLFRRQMIEDLRVYTQAMMLTGLPDETKDYDALDGSIRITIIDADGVVLYDNEADATAMENHGDRPEVAQAYAEGEGSSIRHSDTMQRNTYYYAVLLADGSVLRVARDAHNLWSILYSALPIIVIMLCVLVAVCVLLSHFLTKSLLRPIARMAEDMDHIPETEIYPELAPFAETIHAQHEDILRNANMRQEFTANVSHELKTPLAAISGYAELIETGMAGEEDVPRFAAGIRQSSQRLLGLINDTIRLSELDASAQDTPFEKLDLTEIARENTDLLSIRAEQKSVLLTVEGTPCPVMGDKQMLGELVYNLCDNAISYNNVGGSVLVWTGLIDDAPVLRVKDTGIGISPEHQERIFERFYRVDKSRSKQTGGTGLGLAIVKHIVAVHGAELSLVSAVGEGTEITVRFAPCEE